MATNAEILGRVIDEILDKEGDIELAHRKILILGQVIKIQQERLDHVERMLNNVMSTLSDSAVTMERIALILKGGYEQ